MAALASVAEMAEWLGQATPTGAEATRATLCLEAATDKVESLCGRRFSQTTEARTFSPALVNRELLVDDFQSLTLVETRYMPSLDYDVLAAGSYERHRPRSDWPYNRLLRTDYLYWPSGADSVRLTGTWGWDTPPPDTIKLAVIMGGAGLFQSNLSPGGALADYDGSDIPTIFGYDQRMLQMLDVYRNSGAMFA